MDTAPSTTEAYVAMPGKKRWEVRQHPLREMRAGDVLVRTEALAVHPSDLDTRAGNLDMLMYGKRPYVPGGDLVGVVVAMGSDVSDAGDAALRVGTRVAATISFPLSREITFGGAYARHAVVPAAWCAVVPDTLDVAAAAAVPNPAQCAYQALEAAQLHGGSTILVLGGAGGTGSVAVQLFAAAGHRVVAVGSARSAAYMRELGACATIDYATQRVEEEVGDVDMVFDTVGGKALRRSFAVVRPGGVVVTLCGAPSVAEMRAAFFRVPWLMARAVGVWRWWLGHERRAARCNVRYVPLLSRADGEPVRRAMAVYARDGCKLRVAKRVPFAQLEDALDAVERKDAGVGCVVVTVGAKDDDDDGDDDEEEEGSGAE